MEPTGGAQSGANGLPKTPLWNRIEQVGNMVRRVDAVWHIFRSEVDKTSVRKSVCKINRERILIMIPTGFQNKFEINVRIHQQKEKD